MNRPCVYIAGPLNALAVDYLKNVSRFLSVQVMLIRKGYAPYNPASDFLAGLMAGDLEYEDYFEPNFAWLEKADVVFLLDPSPGADRECARARELGIPVVRSLKELEELVQQEWVDGLPVDADA